MAVMLYTHGDEYEIRGVRCNLGRFDNDLLEEKLAEGWVINPADLVQTLNIETMETEEPKHPVRIAAKAAGIEGWDKKRIGTLEEALK